MQNIAFERAMVNFRKRLFFSLFVFTFALLEDIGNIYYGPVSTLQVPSFLPSVSTFAKRIFSFFCFKKKKIEGMISHGLFFKAHPMKPHRIRMAHNLILNYGLYEQLQVFRPRLASFEDMTRFHTDDYINFLKLVTPQTRNDFTRQLMRFNVGDDCPLFDGLYKYCQTYTGGQFSSLLHSLFSC
jgi:hypothetical protein